MLNIYIDDVYLTNIQYHYIHIDLEKPYITGEHTYSIHVFLSTLLTNLKLSNLWLFGACYMRFRRFSFVLISNVKTSEV